MIKKYHNHKLQTNLWHREEEPHNNHKTLGRQKKQPAPIPIELGTAVNPPDFLEILA